MTCMMCHQSPQSHKGMTAHTHTHTHTHKLKIKRPHSLKIKFRIGECQKLENKN